MVAQMKRMLNTVDACMLVLCLLYAVVDRAFESWAFSAENVLSFSEQLHRYHHSPKPSGSGN